MKNWKVISAVVGLVVVLGLIAYVSGGDAADDGSSGPAMIASAEVRDIEVVAEAAGTVEPITTVEVKSKASGEVRSVLGETGDLIEAGTLLAEIDPRDVQNALDQARAELASAQVRLEVATAQRDRMQALRESGVVTQQEYESALESASAARASVVRAETDLQLATERRQDVTIRAPISGTLIQRTVEPGQIIASATSNVSGGSTLFTMADMSEMQVRALIDETDIGTVSSGQIVDVTVEAYPGRIFGGTVYKIEPQAVVEQNVTMFPVLVRLPNPAGLLKPGMNAEVAIQIARRPGVVAVPNGAVVAVRDANSTAAALGLPEDAMALAMNRPATASGNGGEMPAAGADGGPSADCMALMQRVRSGGGPGSLSEQDRAAMQECRSQFGGGGAGRAGGGGGGGFGGGFAGRGQRQPASDSPLASRPGVVFVQTDSIVEPRRVTLGTSDWEYTEIIDGLAEGEMVILVTIAQLQQDQQEMTDRFRQRAGGIVPGGPPGRR